MKTAVRTRPPNSWLVCAVLLRDLFVTILLSCLITVGLLHCIWLYLSLFFPLALPTPTPCELASSQTILSRLVLPLAVTVDLAPLQSAIASLTYADVLRVTTGFTLVIFAAVELAAFLRNDQTTHPITDVEYGAKAHWTTEKLPPEKPYIVLDLDH
ncbi:hypothetical protein MIND_00829200 [Mycena indigotica]|uniref:Uncharacterized protein n=1 Tax=Mycena indigotica TaxID=2126181 RepID=A0A8H6W0S1_9AGAR|nr:uncharacterized protein MIND_00829200 [Mycena indigotica]KAF7298816.1 hypothetical protein MIND_00829200 [Mycena indigotica]